MWRTPALLMPNHMYRFNTGYYNRRCETQHVENILNMESRDLCSRFDAFGQELGTLGKAMHFMFPLFSHP